MADKLYSKVVICSGGTGGHLFPAIALVDELKVNHHHFVKKNVLIQMIIDSRAQNYINSFSNQYNILTINVCSLAKKGFFLKAKAIFLLSSSLLRCLLSFIKARPKVVVSFGSYVSVPPVIAAILLRIPLVLHEQNAYAGKVNRLFARFAKVVTTAFPQTKGLKKYADKIVNTGTPVRKEFISIRNKPKPNNINLRKILIFGGSQGAKFFTDIIPLGAGLLAEDMQSNLIIYNQCRFEDLSKSQKLWSLTKCEVEIKPFFNNMPELMFNSDLIICRSGASSISEINCVGRAAVYIPYKYATNNHQFYNAQAIVQKRAAMVFNENDLTPIKVKSMIEKVFSAKDELLKVAFHAKQYYSSDSLSSVMKIVLSYV